MQVWEGYEKVKEIHGHEAGSPAALYRNVNEYPEPIRTPLRGRIRTYAYQIIHDTWPLQRQGKTPIEGVKSMDQLQTMLVRFEPATEAQTTDDGVRGDRVS